MTSNLQEIINKAESTHELTKNEIVELLANDEINQVLFKTADRVREKYVGNEVHLRGLIEFSNICSKNCFYCGLRRDNKNIKRYRLEPEIIIDFATKASSYGYKTFVLQSGEGNIYKLEEMLHIISEIKKLNVAVTLSIGEKTEEEYKAYKDAGADRFLLRIETTDKELYQKLHNHKDKIEADLGEKAEWMELPGKKASRIKVSMRGVFDTERGWEHYFEWLLREAEKFHSIFPKYLK